MTLSTEPFRTLHDAMNDRHSNPGVPLTYRNTNSIPTTAPASDRVDEAELVLFAKLHKLSDISYLRDVVVRAGESWPPRRAWFDGYSAGYSAGYLQRDSEVQRARRTR